MNVMQKSTCKYLTFTIYRHVACRAVTMVITMGGGQVDGGDGESPAVPSIVHAVEFLGRGDFGYLGFKMPIDSSVGHHKKLRSYTWSIVT